MMSLINVNTANRGKNSLIAVLLCILPFLCAFVSLLIGRYGIDSSEALEILWGAITGAESNTSGKAAVIITEIRFPRAVLGLLVGASLAVSGAAFQGLFCNPLVNSGILGVSSGAGFGAALAIILFGIGNHTFIFAFTFGCIAVGMSYMIGRVYNTTSTIMLVLGGTVVSAIFSALLSFLKYVADPYNQLPAITFWLMGSLASVTKESMLISAIPMLIGITGILMLRWRLNILSMGDNEAKALGINVSFTKGTIICCATLATAGAVCVSGVIGWIGLVIPHVARMLFGSDNKVIVPASISLGAAFMVIVDTLSRSVTGSEIPLGILTALLGGPFFIYLLKKIKGGGW